MEVSLTTIMQNSVVGAAMAAASAQDNAAARQEVGQLSNAVGFSMKRAEFEGDRFAFHKHVSTRAEAWSSSRTQYLTDGPWMMAGLCSVERPSCPRPPIWTLHSAQRSRAGATSCHGTTPSSRSAQGGPCQVMFLIFSWWHDKCESRIRRMFRLLIPSSADFWVPVLADVGCQLPRQLTVDEVYGMPGGGMRFAGSLLVGGGGGGPGGGSGGRQVLPRLTPGR